VRKNLAVDDLGDLLELPLLAVLATHRRDGTVLLSPVWHEWRDGGFVVATSSDNVKARHLRHDPRAGIVVCEQTPPYRGIELRGSARLTNEGADETPRRIATRYLGEAEGAAKAAEYGDDLLIRLEPGVLRAWDFSDEYALSPRRRR
jgi:PPOX class probable F420-dependent enzyme